MPSGETNIAMSGFPVKAVWESCPKIGPDAQRSARDKRIGPFTFWSYGTEEAELMSVTYSADIWDGQEAHDSLGVATAVNETEAIQKAKAWAKSLTSVPEDEAWLRVNINGVLHSFRLASL